MELLQVVSTTADEWTVRGIGAAIIAVLLYVVKHQANRLAEIEKERDAERIAYRDKFERAQRGNVNGQD